MDVNDIRVEVLSILAERIWEYDDGYEDNMSLTADLGADSIDMTDVCMGCETSFGISISSDEMKGIETIGDLIRLVCEKKGIDYTI